MILKVHTANTAWSASRRVSCATGELGRARGITVRDWARAASWISQRYGFRTSPTVPEVVASAATRGHYRAKDPGWPAGGIVVGGPS